MKRKSDGVGATPEGPGGVDDLEVDGLDLDEDLVDLGDDLDIEGRGERAIDDTPDPHFNLVSVLYHALQGVDTGELYVEDAVEADDDELAAFFREVVDEERQRAERAKALLAERLAQREPATRRRAA